MVLISDSSVLTCYMEKLGTTHKQGDSFKYWWGGANVFLVWISVRQFSLTCLKSHRISYSQPSRSFHKLALKKTNSDPAVGGWSRLQLQFVQFSKQNKANASNNNWIVHWAFISSLPDDTAELCKLTFSQFFLSSVFLSLNQMKKLKNSPFICW